MKAIFIAFNQAYNEEVVELLESFGQRGYTQWENIQGRGSTDGEPHLDSHAWPTSNYAVLTVVPDHKCPQILEALHKKDEESSKLGLRAFVWNIESSI